MSFQKAKNLCKVNIFIANLPCFLLRIITSSILITLPIILFQERAKLRFDSPDDSASTQSLLNFALVAATGDTGKTWLHEGMGKKTRVYKKAWMREISALSRIFSWEDKNEMCVVMYFERDDQVLLSGNILFHQRQI